MKKLIVIIFLFKSDSREPDMPIDVTSLPPPTSIAYDTHRAQSVMNECERHVTFARANPEEERSEEEWEENVTRYSARTSRSYQDHPKFAVPG